MDETGDNINNNNNTILLLPDNNNNNNEEKHNPEPSETDMIIGSEIIHSVSNEECIVFDETTRDQNEVDDVTTSDFVNNNNNNNNNSVINVNDNDDVGDNENNSNILIDETIQPTHLDIHQQTIITDSNESIIIGESQLPDTIYNSNDNIISDDYHNNNKNIENVENSDAKIEFEDNIITNQSTEQQIGIVEEERGEHDQEQQSQVELETTDIKPELTEELLKTDEPVVQTYDPTIDLDTLDDNISQKDTLFVESTLTDPDQIITTMKSDNVENENMNMKSEINAHQQQKQVISDQNQLQTNLSPQVHECGNTLVEEVLDKSLHFGSEDTQNTEVEPEHETTEQIETHIYETTDLEHTELKDYENVTLQQDYITTETNLIINYDDPNEFYVTHLPRPQSVASSIVERVENEYQQFESVQSEIPETFVDSNKTESLPHTPVEEVMENHQPLAKERKEQEEMEAATESVDKNEVKYDEFEPYENAIDQFVQQTPNTVQSNDTNDVKPTQNEQDIVSLNSEGMTNETDFEKRYAMLLSKYRPNYQANLSYDTKRRTKTLDRYNMSNKYYSLNQNRWSYYTDYNEQKRRAVTLERNESRRRRRPMPKPAINDDYLYPDSVTPTKVDRGISVRSLEEGIPEGRYNVPYIDDDAFIPKRLRQNKSKSNTYHTSPTDNEKCNGINGKAENHTGSADDNDDDQDDSELSFVDDGWLWDPNPNYFNKLEVRHTADTSECTVTPEIQSKSQLTINDSQTRIRNKKKYSLLCGLCSRKKRNKEKH